MSDLAGFLGAAYLWVKAAHILRHLLDGRLFLLPRFYVYHHAPPRIGRGSCLVEREDRTRTIILGPQC